MIDWKALKENKHLLFGQLKNLLTQERYGKDWNVADLIADGDPRKHFAYMVLSGDEVDGTRNQEGFPRLEFRLKVLTRQACCRTKDGRAIWAKHVAKETQGSDRDIVPSFEDKPKAGDVVEWKGQAFTHCPDTGAKVDGAMVKAWARQGKRACRYYEFTVDADGCITVPWQAAHPMLMQKGKNIAQPRFRKIDLREKTEQKKNFRKLTNWWFEEALPTAPETADLTAE